MDIDNTMPHPVVVKIQGKAYQIACPPKDLVKLEEAVSLVDDKMAKLSHNENSERETVAILTALNFANELQRARNRAQVEVNALKAQISALNRKFNALLQPATDPATSAVCVSRQMN